LSIRFQADADLNFDIVKAVRQQEPAIDLASAVEAGLHGVSAVGRGDSDFNEAAIR